MQQLLIDDIPVGAKLAQSVRDQHGRTIFQAGTVIDESHVRVLQRLATGTVMVSDLPQPLVAPRAVPIPAAALSRVETALQATLDSVRNPGPNGVRVVSPNVMQQAGRVLMTEVTAGFRRPLRLDPIPADAPYDLIHPIRTATLAMRVAVGMNMSDVDIEKLGTASLVHDIGNLLLPAELRDHANPLTPEQRRELERHAQLGQDLLKRNGFDPIVCATVLQHHEWWSGTGYPYKRAGKQIFKLARVLGPASAYVALISARPHRPGYLPHEAMECLVGFAGDFYDPDVIATLVTVQPAYPFGTRVVLDGELSGTIVDPNVGQPGRPIVRLDKGPLIDLAAPEHLHRCITATIPEPVEPEEEPRVAP
jgi:HD-GYP domain-containing protein (c-di-GMP phosphodiesterase class II)